MLMYIMHSRCICQNILRIDNNYIYEITICHWEQENHEVLVLFVLIDCN